MRRFNIWMLTIALAFGAAGCAMNNAALPADNAPSPSSPTAGAASTSGASSSADASSAAGSAGQAGTTVPAPPPIKMAPGFDDIPVPAGLTRNDKLSFVYEAPSVTMGVITYSGYDKGASVAKFFRTEMPNYGWQFLNAFSEGDQYMVAFLKADRSCIINIEEGTLSTTVTIKVGPTNSGGIGAGGGAGSGAGSPPLHYEVGQ